MRRVITYGTFDLLHYGHINLLRRAKKCYFSYEKRKALVEAIRYVDLVIPEESWEQKRHDMHEYHIDTFVMGDDWDGCSQKEIVYICLFSKVFQVMDYSSVYCDFGSIPCCFAVHHA